MERRQHTAFRDPMDAGRQDQLPAARRMAEGDGRRGVVGSEVCRDQEPLAFARLVRAERRAERRRCGHRSAMAERLAD